MKILAVDDHHFILELLTMMVARAGFKDVATASSGARALEMLKDSDTAFDCLLLDIAMPDMDGIELCALVRAMPAYRKTPIIMLTAMAERKYIELAFRAGATDYANKPLDIVELNARLRLMEEVVIARKDAGADGTTEAMPPDSGPDLPFALSDEIAVLGIPDLIDYTALGNYLTQLSSAGLGGAQVMAVKIDRIDRIYAKASTDEFPYALTEAADAISEVLRPYGYMMAYAGDGVFVVVAHKASLEPAASLESEIQNLLDEKNSEYDNGDPLDIEVSIGNPIRPNTSKTQRVRKTFDRAIARAENRLQRKIKAPSPLNIRLVGR